MKRLLLFILPAAIIGGASGILCSKYAIAQDRHSLSDSPHSLPAPASRSVPSGVATLPDFTYAAENSVAGVVHVTTTFPRRNIQSIQEYLQEYFFGYRAPRQERQPAMGSGSGVALTTDGYIVTNNHVIERASEIHVKLYDRRVFAARLVGADPATDIAVLKIDATGLPFIPFGNSDSLRLGEWVLAIGNPYGLLNSTITAGIVSAKGRNMPASDGRYKIESFIQTDAAVNPGNSGGALVNTRGELVGINTAIASPTGSFSGYSFAVPESIVRKVVEDIIQYGAVQRVILGITMTDVTDALAKKLELQSLNGVLVMEVIKGGAAEKAGIKQGDVITHIDGIEVGNAPAVQERIALCRPGQQIEIIVERGGKERYFNVVMAAAENS